VDEVLKGSVSIGWDRPATLWRFPVETVSQSESGWEKTYQSSVVMPIWHLELNPGEEWRVGFNLGVDW
jgi:alpha-amylase